MDTEGQRRSENVEDRGQETPFQIWVRQSVTHVRQGLDTVIDALDGPEKEVRNRYYVPTGPDPSDDPSWAMNNYIMETWYHLREANPEQLERAGPEFVNARRLIDQAEAEHGYLNDNEALSGYLYDLDSRGIRMTTYWGRDGKEHLDMRVDEYDYAGNRIADATIAESRALVERRALEAFAQSVVEGNPRVGDITPSKPVGVKPL